MLKVQGIESLLHRHRMWRLNSQHIVRVRWVRPLGLLREVQSRICCVGRCSKAGGKVLLGGSRGTADRDMFQRHKDEADLSL